MSCAPEQKLRHDELKSKLIDVFGLNIPNHVIDSCARFLLNDRAIKKHPDGSGYELIEQRFDISRFETEKTALELSEKALINDLISFVSTKYSPILNTVSNIYDDSLIIGIVTAAIINVRPII